MKATYQKYILNFKRPSGTSRGVLNEKETWFLILDDNGKKELVSAEFFVDFLLTIDLIMKQNYNGFVLIFI